MFHTVFTTPTQGLGLTSGSALPPTTVKSTADPQHAWQSGWCVTLRRSVLCSCGGGMPMFSAWRDASPVPILFVLNCFGRLRPERAKPQRQGWFRGAVVSVGTHNDSQLANPPWQLILHTAMALQNGREAVHIRRHSLCLLRTPLNGDGEAG